jgi:hypothetical protein
MPKLGDVIAAGGVLPALATGALGDENKGFALGLIPGLAYRDRERKKENESTTPGMKKGGKTKKMAKGGQTGYRKAADGCVTKGKTRGRMV